MLWGTCLKRWSDDPIWYQDELTWIWIGRRSTYLYHAALKRWACVGNRPQRPQQLGRPACSLGVVPWREFRRASGWRSWLAVLEDLLGWRFLSFRLDGRWEPPKDYDPRREEPPCLLLTPYESTERYTEVIDG